jgi:L-ascorbate metabolism protein UlaG (beta-lactamase superfamily)
MDPRQAAVAAGLLGARLAVPIHYGPLHEAPNYVQAEDPAGSFESAAAELGVDVRVLSPECLGLGVSRLALLLAAVSVFGHLLR